MSPHPSLYQNTPTGSFYQRASSNSVPTLNADALERRKKLAPEGPQAGVGDKKGKKKAVADAQSPSSTHGAGVDPLEIAYGQTVGTHTKITRDDFQVDTDQGQHKPHQESTRSSREGKFLHRNEHLIEGTSHEWEEDDGDRETSRDQSLPYGIGEEDEFRNVWGR